MAVDSVAVFKERVAALRLHDYWHAFAERGWDTYANFAFAPSNNPATADDDKFSATVLQPLLGEDLSNKPVAAVRRLFFEAYTLAGADLKRKNRGCG